MIPEVITWTPGMDIKPGFYEIPAEAYHGRDKSTWPLTLSASIAKVIELESPLHAWHLHSQLGGNRREDTDSLDYGTVAHTLILDKGKNLAIGEFADWRKNEAKQFRDDARAAGLIPVLECKMAAARSMKGEFERQVKSSEAWGFYAPGTHTEIAAIFEYEGVLCQCLFDRVNLSTGEIYDIKTISSANPKPVAQQIYKMGYDIQARFYELALETLIPELAGRIQFTFLFMESSAPHALLPVQLSGVFEQTAENRLTRSINTWKECVATDTWPGYGSQIMRMDPPPWAMAAEFAESL